MTPSDGDIIKRSLHASAAFAEIYDRHERSVYRYVARRIGLNAADDVTSETFLVAFTRLEAYDGAENARPWLLGIATVLIQKFSRLEARAWKGMLASDLAQVTVDEFHAVDSRLDATALARRMGKAIARLAPGDRDVLLLHTFGELDYAGMATALNIPVGTVRSRLNRARQKLRTSIGLVSALDSKDENGRDLAPAASTK